MTTPGPKFELDDGPPRIFSMEEIAAALFKTYGITSGLWRLGAKLRFAGVTGGWEDESGSRFALPTGMVGMEGIGLAPTKVPGELVFDASVLNGQAPATKRRAAAVRAKP